MFFRTLAIALIAVTSCWAIPVFDQQQPNDTFSFLAAPTDWQQGITAGISGQLTGIDLYWITGGPVTFGINLGAPWQTDTDSAVISSPPFSPSGWNHYDLTSAGIYLVAGQQFTVRFLGYTAGFGGAGPN